MRIIMSVVVVASVVLVCLAAYFVGYRRGHRAESYDHTKWDLHVYPELYREAESDDTNQLQKNLRDLIVLRIVWYDKQFSNETVTDDWFIADLKYSHALEAQSRAEWAEYNRTNRMSNTASEPMPTAP